MYKMRNTFPPFGATNMEWIFGDLSYLAWYTFKVVSKLSDSCIMTGILECNFSEGLYSSHNRQRSK